VSGVARRRSRKAFRRLDSDSTRGTTSILTGARLGNFPPPLLSEVSATTQVKAPNFPKRWCSSLSRPGFEHPYGCPFGDTFARLSSGTEVVSFACCQDFRST